MVRERGRRVSVTQVQVQVGMTLRPSRDIVLEGAEEESAMGNYKDGDQGEGGDGSLKRSKTLVSIESF